MMKLTPEEEHALAELSQCRSEAERMAVAKRLGISRHMIAEPEAVDLARSPHLDVRCEEARS